MKKAIGSKINIHLNNDEVISGTLIDSDNVNSYVQSSPDKIYILFNKDIKYAIMDIESEPVKEPQPSPIKEPQSQVNMLKVYIDDHLTATIPTSADLSKWNELIYKIALSNPDVHNNLSNKIQKTVEYFPGELYIISEGDRGSVGGDNFSMGASSPISPTQPSVSEDLANNFLDPAQMVARLNKMVPRKESK